MQTSAAISAQVPVDKAIATAWAQDAQSEHASIASFARFTLELLAVGAPPKLLIASQDAGRDEVQHAQKCFTIASHFAGVKLGPGPLDISGVGGARDLASITVATVHEGCINETLSAEYARARAEGAEASDVRAALTKIAEDEQRHAELAWNFVSWAIGAGGPSIREAVLRAFEDGMKRPPGGFNPVLRGVPAEVARANGLLDEATADAVARRTVDELIAPRIKALPNAASP